MNQCPRCRGSLLRGGCLACGDVSAPVAVVEPDDEFEDEDEERPRKTGLWAAEESAFVEEHLFDMSTRQIADALWRTERAVEHHIAAKGWKKGYVSATEEPLPVFPWSSLSKHEISIVWVLERVGPQGRAMSLAEIRTATGCADPAPVLRKLINRGILVRQRRRDGWWGDLPTLYRLAPSTGDPCGVHTTRVRGAKK